MFSLRVIFHVAISGLRYAIERTECVPIRHQPANDLVVDNNVYDTAATIAIATVIKTHTFPWPPFLRTAALTIRRGEQTCIFDPLHCAIFPQPRLYAL